MVLRVLDVTGSSELALGNAVNWRFAATVGEWLARPSPPSTEYTRCQVIDELTNTAVKAEPLVCDITRLATDGAVPLARVVDRPAWIRAAAESMRVMMNGTDRPRGFLTGRLIGAQMGAVLAFVASGILGQYDPFGASEGGCLLLVYPNVIAIERQLRVEPSDFRMWVCLHEVTHRVQFTANPWLFGYMSRALGTLTHESDANLGPIVRRLTKFVRTRGDASDDSDTTATGILGLVRAVQSESQRKALDQLLVLGTLLEGHAEHVMDAAGPVVVPSVATIRSRFDDRRHRTQPPLQRLLRALLGFDAKLSQYTRGKAFVDQVVGQVGMERFNTIWSGPETLPLPSELQNPGQWIDRVL